MATIGLGYRKYVSHPPHLAAVTLSETFLHLSTLVLHHPCTQHSHEICIYLFSVFTDQWKHPKKRILLKSCVYQVVVEVHDLDGRLEQVKCLLQNHGFQVVYVYLTGPG